MFSVVDLLAYAVVQQAHQPGIYPVAEQVVEFHYAVAELLVAGFTFRYLVSQSGKKSRELCVFSAHHNAVRHIVILVHQQRNCLEFREYAQDQIFFLSCMSVFLKQGSDYVHELPVLFHAPEVLWIDYAGFHHLAFPDSG